MFLVNGMFIFETSVSSKQTITCSVILYTFLSCEWLSNFKKLFQCGKLENTERPKGNSSVDSSMSQGPSNVLALGYSSPPHTSEATLSKLNFKKLLSPHLRIS